MPTAPRLIADRSPLRNSSCRGISLVAILLSLLLVALATLAVGSTIVARRATEARDRARTDFAATSRGLDQLVETLVATKPVKKELLQPALDYYEKFVQAHGDDPLVGSQVASARFHMAAIHAKLGSKEAVAQMSQGLQLLDQLVADPQVDPATLPSLQDAALKVTTPIEWFMVKGADRAYGLQLVVAISRALTTYRGLSKQHPHVATFRDNVSALLKGSALLNAQLPGGASRALTSWLEARDVLETLVRDQPDNKDYQIRLAESLVNAARIQKTDKQTDKALTNMQRAVEVGEALAAAHPDDKSLTQNLTVAKRELDRLAAAPAEKPAASVAEKEKPTGEAPAAAGPTEAEAPAAPTEPQPAPSAEADAPVSPQPPAADGAPPTGP